jgi:hypothetical protein
MTQTAHRIVRATILGAIGGHTCDNVWWMYADENEPLDGRPRAVTEAMTQLCHEWSTQILQLVTNTYEFLGVDWVDYDTADGITGHTAPASGDPITGSAPGSGSAPAVAMLVQKQISGGRGTKNGRCYLAGIPEGNVDPMGVLASDYLAASQTVWDTFLTNMTNGVGDGLTFPSHLVTVTWPTIVVGGKRKPDPDGVGVPHDINTLTVASTVATQRRRQRR